MGAGANLRGRAVIGNRPGNAFDYVHAQDYYVASMHAAYERRFAGRVRTKFQVNVSNLFDNDELILTGYGNLRPGAANATTAFLPNRFRYLDPRKVTFSTTFTF